VDSQLLLVLGLGLVFVALVLVFSYLFLRQAGPTGVERSLAVIDAVHVTAPKDLRAQELARPFSERVVDPLLTSFVQVGRRFTPDERVLNWDNAKLFDPAP